MVRTIPGLHTGGREGGDPSPEVAARIQDLVQRELLLLYIRWEAHFIWYTSCAPIQSDAHCSVHPVVHMGLGGRVGGQPRFSGCDRQQRNGKTIRISNMFPPTNPAQVPYPLV